MNIFYRINYYRDFLACFFIIEIAHSQKPLVRLGRSSDLVFVLQRIQRIKIGKSLFSITRAFCFSIRYKLNVNFLIIEFDYHYHC